MLRCTIISGVWDEWVNDDILDFIACFARELRNRPAHEWGMGSACADADGQVWALGRNHVLLCASEILRLEGGDG